MSSLTKVQLCAVAEHYQLSLTPAEKSKRETLLKAVKGQLILTGVLESEADTDSDQLQYVKLEAEREARVLRE